MPRKLRIDSLKADLSAVSNLLKEAEEIGDFVGKLQYSYRKKEIEAAISLLEEHPISTASVALFFGGKPVLGSRGILAEFASKALEEFQALVSKVQASTTIGKFGERGRVPEISNSKLMITELSKGSFGFVLTELLDQSPLFSTVLRETVATVSKLIFKTGQSDESEFEEILPEIDQRSLISLKNFFSELDKSGANLRIVEDDKEFVLDEESVSRGRIRTESTSIDEDTTAIVGSLIGFLPEHRKFEFLSQDGSSIYGSATKEVAERFKDLISNGVQVLNTPWRLAFEVRVIKPLNRPEKVVYKLLEIQEPVSEQK